MRKRTLLRRHAKNAKRWLGLRACWAGKSLEITITRQPKAGRPLPFKLTNRPLETIMTSMIGGIAVSTTTEQSDTWTVREAKARFSEVIEQARHHGPQSITRHGKSAVVIVDATLWAEKQKTGRQGGLADFLKASPLRDADIEIVRLKDAPREIEL